MLPLRAAAVRAGGWERGAVSLLDVPGLEVAVDDPEADAPAAWVVDDKRAHFLSPHFTRAPPDPGGNRRSRRAAMARERKGAGR